MRHPIRFVTFLIGVWFGCVLAISAIVPSGFRLVDQTMAQPHPAAREVIDQLGPETSRQFLRFQISETNRKTFYYWGWAQVILAALVVGFLVFATPVGRISVGISGLMLLMSVWMKVWLIPKVEDLSRLMDFQKAGQVNPNAERFLELHRIFGIFELAILVLGAVLILRFLHHTRSRHTVP